MTAGRRALVTRPQPQADQWVQLLQEQGVEAVALPLLDIVSHEPAPAERETLVQSLAQHALVMFVSPNAVASFQAGWLRGRPWPAGTLAGAPGPGTAQALADAGVPLPCIVTPPAQSPQWDSAALWQGLQARDWRGRQVLVVRGEEGRDWLADTLGAAGARVAFLAAYRRTAPAWGPPQRQELAAALAEPAGHAWVFSSSQAVGHLVQHLQGTGAAPPWAGMLAVATHPRIAQAAARAGFGRVLEATPTPQAVAASVRAG